MEMLDSRHKEVPFGWMLSLQEALARRAVKRAIRKAERAQAAATRPVDPPRFVYYR